MYGMFYFSTRTYTVATKSWGTPLSIALANVSSDNCPIISMMKWHDINKNKPQ